MRENQKVFIKIIEALEERNWEYQVTYTHIQIELGNEFYNVSKDNLTELEELYEEIISW